MNYKAISLGLGFSSIAIGVTELLLAKRIAKVLDATGNEGLIMGYGVREIVSGVTLLRSPGSSAGVWGRAVGDAADLAALSVAAKRSPRNGAIWFMIAASIGAGLIDVAVARGLETEA